MTNNLNLEPYAVKANYDFTNLVWLVFFWLYEPKEKVPINSLK